MPAPHSLKKCCALSFFTFYFTNGLFRPVQQSQKCFARGGGHKPRLPFFFFSSPLRALVSGSLRVEHSAGEGSSHNRAIMRLYETLVRRLYQVREKGQDDGVSCLSLVCPRTQRRRRY